MNVKTIGLILALNGLVLLFVTGFAARYVTGWTSIAGWTLQLVFVLVFGGIGIMVFFSDDEVTEG